MTTVSKQSTAVMQHHKLSGHVTCVCGALIDGGHCCEFSGEEYAGLRVEDCRFDEDAEKGCMVCLKKMRYNRHLAATYYDRSTLANCCGRCMKDLAVCTCSGFMAEDGHMRCKNCRGLWDDSRDTKEDECLFCGFDGVGCSKSGFLASDGEMRCARCSELWDAVCTRCGSGSGACINEDGDEVCKVCRWVWNDIACRLCRYRGGKLHINNFRLYGFRG